MTSLMMVLLCFVSSFSFAQSGLVNKTSTTQSTVRKSNSNTMEKAFSSPNDSITKGYRIGFTRPYYGASMDFAFPAQSGITGNTSDPSINYTNGLKFGYTYLPVQSLGFIADFDYLEINMEESSNNIARLDGNAAFAINSYINIHGGLNYAKLVGKGASNWDAGYGSQLGLGCQITRNFGFELNYSETNLSAAVSLSPFSAPGFASVDVKIHGYDLNFIGTF